MFLHEFRHVPIDDGIVPDKLRPDSERLKTTVFVLSQVIPRQADVQGFVAGFCPVQVHVAPVS